MGVYRKPTNVWHPLKHTVNRKWAGEGTQLGVVLTLIRLEIQSRKDMTNY